MRALLAILGCLATAHVARAQPADPYGPAPTPAPAPPADPVLAEQVAAALAQRAQELFDAKQYPDARRLANEAIAANDAGNAARQARFIVQSVDRLIGPEPRRPTPAPMAPTPVAPPPVAPTPTPAPAVPEVGAYGPGIEPPPEVTPAPAAPPPGAPLPPIGGPIDAPPRKARSLLPAFAVSGGAIGGATGAFIADLVNTEGTSAGGVTVGILIGGAVGAALGGALTYREKYTAGDIALVDTFAGIGLAGGLTVGMLMQPAQNEAYSLNAILGTAGGVIVGLVAAPETNTTPRRMLRVAGMAAAFGAAPFLIYAAVQTSDSTADERVTGFLSSAGLIAGAYIGFRLTKGMDEGKDVLPRTVDDAPVALVGRHSDGRWAAGGLGLQPLSPQLAPQPGMTLSVLGARF